MAQKADRSAVSAGPRSCQQSAVYAAENACRIGKVFRTTAAAQAFVDELTAQSWFDERWPNVRCIEVTVKTKVDRSSVGAWYADERIGHCDMLPHHLNERTLCHEVAHVLACARYGSRAHDPWFARIYLELVYHMMGSEAWCELRDALEAAGIDFAVDTSTGGAIAL